MISVEVLVGKTGSPRAVTLDNGLLYEVSRVLIKRSDENGDRYICIIGCRQVELLNVDDSWRQIAQNCRRLEVI